MDCNGHVSSAQDIVIPTTQRCCVSYKPALKMKSEEYDFKMLPCNLNDALHLTFHTCSFIFAINVLKLISFAAIPCPISIKINKVYIV